MAEEKIRTRQVRVKVFARNGATIEGLAHVHAGAYKRRISDVLNVSPPNFLPITDARYERGDVTYESDTVLVNTADIVMLETPSDEARAIGDDTDMPGSSL